VAKQKRAGSRTSSTSRTSKTDTVKQRRHEQLMQIRHAVSVLKAKLQDCQADQRRQGLLESVSLGMYDEVDKLTKKAPAEPVTELVLEQVNDVIRETKQLAQEDSYVQKLAEFVPAGDFPELRDVLFVLRQIRQGLARSGKSFDQKEKDMTVRLNEAHTIQTALELSLQGYTSISSDNILEHGVGVSQQWMWGDFHEKHFNFKHLDAIEIEEYFKAP
jgi:hypothetical protein